MQVIGKVRVIIINVAVMRNTCVMRMTRDFVRSTDDKGLEDRA